MNLLHATRIIGLATVTWGCLTMSGQAATVQLSDRASLATLAGATAVTEDFEGFAAGAQSSPLSLAGGVSYEAPTPAVFPGSIGGNALFDNSTTAAGLTARRTFSLPAGSTLFGADFALTDRGSFDFFINGGASPFTTVQGSATPRFIGFQDPSGLSSVAIAVSPTSSGGPGVNAGGYSIDNVTIGSLATAGAGGPAGGAPVPLPAAAPLLGFGLAVLGFLRRRPDQD